MPISQKAMAWSWARVDRRGPDECWPWTGSKSPKGYGRFKTDGVDLRASRIVCETVHGPIPDGLFVLHVCDTLPCCNPAHLSPGTPRRNQVEAVERGRRPAGLRGSHPRAKLTQAEADEIRASSLPGIVLAARYCVVKSTITFIRRRPSQAEVERRRARRAEVLIEGGHSLRR